MLNIQIIHDLKCSLGEGCQVSPCQNYAAWVDIVKQNVYVYNSFTMKVSEYHLDSVPSAILHFSNSKLTLLDDKGIIQFDVDSKKTERINVFDEISSCNDLRGNDGIFFAGKYFFGTMQYSPGLNTGALYCFDGNELAEFDKISIPNTFIPLDNSLLISDSMTQQIYRYNLADFSKTLWCDLSGTDMTPDGGCISATGRIFIAMWGASCIVEFDQQGQQITKYPVPAQNPTNCCFFSGKLLVTSANIDIVSGYEALQNGQTFLIEI